MAGFEVSDPGRFSENLARNTRAEAGATQDAISRVEESRGLLSSILDFMNLDPMANNEIV